jgi:arylsulfatase A-like enzyme
MQGSNLAQVVTGNSGKVPDAVYFQIFHATPHIHLKDAWRGIRTEQYMYARTENGPWVMYDVMSDRYELRNLATDTGIAGIRGELDDRLAAWMKSIGDSWSLNHTPYEELDGIP